MNKHSEPTAKAATTERSLRRVWTKCTRAEETDRMLNKLVMEGVWTNEVEADSWSIAGRGKWIISENILFNGRVLSVVISVAAQYYTTRVEGSQDPGGQHHLHHLHHQQEGILCDHRDYVSVILI